MRRTAERVDHQLLTHMRAHAIRGPWAAGQRLLVCVSEDRRAAGLVRYTRRMADRLHAPWTALHVETGRGLQLSEEERDQIADTLRLAQSLDGEATTIPGGYRRVAEDVIAFAQANNVTQIVVGTSRRTRWFELLHGSVVHDLIERSGNIGVHVAAADDTKGGPIPRKTVTTARPPSLDPRAYSFSLLAVAAAVVAGELLWPWVGSPNIDLIFLTAIVGIAVRFGLWPSLMSSAVAALSYNFFFTAPFYQFTIADPTNVVAVVFFTIVAIVVSNVAAHARIQAVAAMARAHHRSLYAFSRKLAGTGMLDEVLWATTYQVASMLKARVVLPLPEHDAVTVKMTGMPGFAPTKTDSEIWSLVAFLNVAPGITAEDFRQADSEGDCLGHDTGASFGHIEVTDVHSASAGTPTTQRYTP